MTTSNARWPTLKIVDLMFRGQTTGRDMRGILAKDATSGRGHSRRFSRVAQGVRSGPHSRCREQALQLVGMGQKKEVGGERARLGSCDFDGSYSGITSGHRREREPMSCRPPQPDVLAGFPFFGSGQTRTQKSGAIGDDKAVARN